MVAEIEVDENNNFGVGTRNWRINIRVFYIRNLSC